MSGVTRIAAIVLRSTAPDALARFYRDALDFMDDGSEDPADDRTTKRLVLGTTRLWIERAAPDAVPYPADVPGWSPLFQHCAIRVTDMPAAAARLDAVEGWAPISTHGPETLPADTGGVTAFKFRDPDGHPLELLASPERRSGPLFVGIDHTAISVADVARSIAFYAAFGLVVAHRTLNTGIEQARLDGIAGATVDVVGLRTASGTAPSLELLGYRGAFDRRPHRPADADDVAATCVVFDGDPAARGPRALRDPDGHRIIVPGGEPVPT